MTLATVTPQKVLVESTHKCLEKHKQTKWVKLTTLVTMTVASNRRRLAEWESRQHTRRRCCHQRERASHREQKRQRLQGNAGSTFPLPPTHLRRAAVYFTPPGAAFSPLLLSTPSLFSQRMVHNYIPSFLLPLLPNLFIRFGNRFCNSLTGCWTQLCCSNAYRVQ